MSKCSCHRFHFSDLVFLLPAAFIFISIYFIANHFGIFNTFQLTAQSSLFLFFLFGLLAGFSTCSVTVGSLVCSLRPGLGFYLGRLFSFALFGLLLGFIGQTISLSPSIYTFLSIFLSFIFIYFGLNLLGFNLPSFNFTQILDQKFSHSLLGFFTFFIPCGFTLTIQGIALLSHQPFYASLILTLFCLGTLTPLFFLRRLTTSFRLNQLAGLFIILFSLLTLANHFQPLIPIYAQTSSLTKNQTQQITLTVSPDGYSPNYFVIKQGIPVTWTIISQNVSACTHTLLAPQFFPSPLILPTFGQSVFTFTPTKTGTFKFSCSMGMVTGYFKVIN